MFNAIGTISRIIILFFLLILVWFCISTTLYLIFIALSGVEFSLNIAFLIFAITIIFRMFYPRNVFK